MTTGKIVYTYGKAGVEQEKPKKGKKKAEAAAQTKEAEQPQEVTPVERSPYRVKFKEYVEAKKLDDKTICGILADCELKQDSDDEDWRIGYQYAVALFGEVETKEVQDEN